MMEPANMEPANFDFSFDPYNKDRHGILVGHYGYGNGRWTEESLDTGIGIIYSDMAYHLNTGKPLTELESAVCMLTTIAQQKPTKQLPKYIQTGAKKYFSTLNNQLTGPIEALQAGVRIAGEQAEILGAQIHCLFGLAKQAETSDLFSPLFGSEPTKLADPDIDPKLARLLVQLGNKHEICQNNSELFKQEYGDLVMRQGFLDHEFNGDYRNCLGYTFEGSNGFLSLRDELLKTEKFQHLNESTENPLKRTLRRAVETTRGLIPKSPLGQENEGPERH